MSTTAEKQTKDLVNKSDTRSFLSIRKLSLVEYELVEVITHKGKIIKEYQLHKDIPGIVLGKFLEKLRAQKVERA